MGNNGGVGLGNYGDVDRFRSRRLGSRGICYDSRTVEPRGARVHRGGAAAPAPKRRIGAGAAASSRESKRNNK